MLAKLRHEAQRHLPAPVQDGLRSALDRMSPHRRRNEARNPEALATLREVSPDGAVLAGPFAGMRMALEGSWGGAAARLAGAYEEELTDELESELGREPHLVVDIGAAEGYYAVGIARRLRASQVITFELDPRGRRLCKRNARLNGVHNLRVLGRATPQRLNRTLTDVPAPLVICDVEGYEAVLMDPSAVPALRSSHLIVELHEFAVKGVTELILGRFRSTHDIVVLDAVDRSGAGRPHLDHLRPELREQVVDEGRPNDPPMQWAVMRPTVTR